MPDDRSLNAPRRRDALRSAVRVTVAVCAGFYTCRYGMQRPVMSVYALFGVIAFGVLSRMTGSARARSAGVVRALPAALTLTAVGTLLAVHTLTAVLGMVVVGFALTFSAVAGPRVAGPSSGLQLCYILACFPPYAPQQIGDRLAGLALGVGLFAAAERWLLPEKPTRGYRTRLALASATAARLAARLAADRGTGEGTDDRTVDAIADDLSPARLPQGERPAAPSRTSRAYAQAGASARSLLHQLRGLTHTRPDCPDALAAALLEAVADTCRHTAEALRDAAPPRPGAVHEAIVRFQTARRRAVRERPEPDPRFRAAVLAAAESARNVELAARVALRGRGIGLVEPRSLFWYADAPTWWLWARRVRAHLTPRSVLFQNAVRVALGLGAARLVAGLLDLSHGFWVLLAVLTLVRTTVVQTRQAVARALAGTLAGALCAAALLTALGPDSMVYAVLLAPVMLATFTLGPLLGIAWAQAMFTVLVSIVFAQLAPATWQLDEVRLLDVLIGSTVGLLCGLLAWPRGARSELLNAMARLLRECAALVTSVTAEILTGPGRGTPVNGEPASHALVLAQTAYAQYLSEPGSPQLDGDATDWHVALMVGQHALAGSYWIPLYDRPDRAALTEREAHEARRQAGTLSRALTATAAAADGGGPSYDPTEPLPPAGPPAADVPELADLEQWLAVLRNDVHLLREPARRPHGAGPS
ncbi:FUSC family protein [Streptomyces sp. NPDC018833]|uniref:FUSC family protein n=1 Tax=Streptomyces sp. NPDC018833 TaxID=3365053 RepID=UPI00378F1F5A